MDDRPVPQARETPSSEPNMAQDALNIGRCYCETGRKRYHIQPNVAIPWESPGITANNAGLNQAAPPGSSSDSDDNDDDTNAVFYFEIDDPLTTIILGQMTNQNNPGAGDPGGLDAGSFLTDDDIDVVTEVDDSAASDDGVNSPPGVAPYRLNLTALSQRYNIYAVAYKNKVHIFRVRSCLSHSLPSRPDLVIEPPRTAASPIVGGYIDRNYPHQMNHLIMGELGDAEILLLACDDGDVIAYYTSHIENALLNLEAGHTLHDATVVKPFLHQNVGISAWGLAVHQKSRLIAVGTNKHEVHVFAFALTDPLYTSQDGYKPPKMPDENELFLLLRKSVTGTLTDVSQAFAVNGEFEIEASKPFSHRRERGYRIVLETGTQGSNIPNVAFGSNADGDAVEVLAIDISGNLWVLDIWSMQDVNHWFVEGLHKTHVKYMIRRNPRHRLPPAHSMPRGWGVLVLPESSFLPTNSFQDSLGLSPEEAVYVNHEYGCYIGTGKAINHVKDNSKLHPWVRSHQLHRFHEALNWRGPEPPREWYDSRLHCRSDWNPARDIMTDASSKCLPDTRPNTTKKERPQSLLADGSSVMRTYEMDIELMGGDVNNIGIMHDNVLYQKKPPRAMIPHLAFDPERLANLLHVPELSLVVAGSLCGRVVLITLTRPVNPQYSFKRGFKVEVILPKKSDEDNFLRPICPLLGVAIGPTPSAGGSMAPPNRLLGERRYRIMLHYYDHRILSYEVYRNLTTNELSVF
ncbi:hypothetical protein F4861DRAFT_509631 [Xylaria intraflava]|nr:hypothetical protein F4861DRAFT_509631 [Xylaria intraflava]